MEHGILLDIARDEELAELRAENARLREIAFGTDRTIQARLATRLGLTPAEAWVLTLLYQRRGDVVTLVQMIEGMPGHADSLRDANCCAVVICRIRKKIQYHGYISTVKGVGYLLQTEGIRWIDSTLG